MYIISFRNGQQKTSKPFGAVVVCAAICVQQENRKNKTIPAWHTFYFTVIKKEIYMGIKDEFVSHWSLFQITNRSQQNDADWHKNKKANSTQSQTIKAQTMKFKQISTNIATGPWRQKINSTHRHTHTHTHFTSTLLYPIITQRMCGNKIWGLN